MPKPPVEVSAGKLLTPEEVADLWSIPVTRLSEWRYKGVGPAFVKIGRQPRYRVEDIEAYVDRHREMPSVSAEIQHRFGLGVR